ncbi:hypothetical protein ES708_17085 [subsurface metagenome]
MHPVLDVKSVQSFTEHFSPVEDQRLCIERGIVLEFISKEADIFATEVVKRVTGSPLQQGHQGVGSPFGCGLIDSGQG